MEQEIHHHVNAKVKQVLEILNLPDTPKNRYLALDCIWDELHELDGTMPGPFATLYRNELADQLIKYQQIR